MVGTKTLPPILPTDVIENVASIKSSGLISFLFVRSTRFLKSLSI